MRDDGRWRTFDLEDIRVRSEGDGRTVEAYAAVFNSPTEIHDRDGHYLEQIDSRAFNKAINDARPAGSRRNWLPRVLFNHGRDMYGTPAAEYTKPLGVALDVKADSRGLLTVVKYSRTPLADEVLELIKDGAITGQSFQGRFVRSDKNPPRRGWEADRDGQLELVTRQEVTLVEFGPTPFPAYQEAAVVGVRHEDLRAQVDEIVAERLTVALATLGAGGRSDTPDGAVEDEPQPHSPSHINLRAKAREKGIL